MLDPSPKRAAGPDTTPTPPALQAPPPGSTSEIVPDGADVRRLGELWNDWFGIQLDTIDSLTAEAAAKVAEIPEVGRLWLLFGEVLVRLHCVELAIDELKRGRR
jgi:hypothetical protein